MGRFNEKRKHSYDLRWLDGLRNGMTLKERQKVKARTRPGGRDACPCREEGKSGLNTREHLCAHRLARAMISYQKDGRPDILSRGDQLLGGPRACAAHDKHSEIPIEQAHNHRISVLSV